MKKKLLIAVILFMAFSLSAFSILKWNSNKTENQTVAKTETNKKDIEELGPYKQKPDRKFIYKIGNRFNTSVTPSQIKSAKTILDLVPEEATRGLSLFENVVVDTLRNNNNTGIWGTDEKLSKAQRNLLCSTSYSSNFYFDADCKKLDTESGALNQSELVYFITVVPENPATYSKGNEALIQYLKDGSKNETESIDWERLWPGSIGFTINKKGEVINIITKSECGQSGIDFKMLELVKNIPGTWKAATDADGNKVAQELIFSYGIEGC